MRALHRYQVVVGGVIRTGQRTSVLIVGEVRLAGRHAEADWRLEKRVFCCCFADP